MEELLNTIQKITDVITKDKDFKKPYYAQAFITLYDKYQDSEDANNYDIKELIYGDPTNPYTISIFKIVEEGYLCDDMPDDFDYGFHDPYEPTKGVTYIIKGLDRKLESTIENELEGGEE